VVKLIDKSARKRRFKAGTTIVEATIVLPLMLMLVFGIAEFGISFTRWNSLTNAVREGARVGVVFRTPCDAATITSLVQTTVSNFADSSGVDTASITTTVTGACGASGSQLIVVSSVPHAYVAVAALAGFSPNATLSARTVMRNE
jgi:Flp pilus assembly protein TadG